MQSRKASTGIGIMDQRILLHGLQTYLYNCLTAIYIADDHVVMLRNAEA